MNKWLNKLTDSPCYKCGFMGRCYEKIDRSPNLREIQDAVFGNPNFDYHNCGIWISFSAPEMVDEEGVD